MQCSTLIIEPVSCQIVTDEMASLQATEVVNNVIQEHSRLVNNVDYVRGICYVS